MRTPTWRRRLRPLYEAALEVLTLGRGAPVTLAGETYRLSPRWHRAFPPDYERQALQFVSERLRPGDTAVDVGAHVGVYSLVMARRVGPSGQVLAIEPNPRAVADLRRHARLNETERTLQVRAQALGAQPGKAVLYTGSGPAGPGTALYSQPGMTTCFEVEVTTLDDLFEDAPAPRLLKLDVEGFERRVLEGGRRLLTRAQGLEVLCEVHVDNLPLLNETPEELHALVRELGYSVHTLAGGPADGFPGSGQYVFRR